jgi:hypothetical protein
MSVLDGIGIFACVVVPLGAVGFLVVVLTKAFLDHRSLKRLVASVPKAQIDRIVGLIEECGTEQPAAAWLVPTEESAPDNAYVILLPEDLHEFPWGGRYVSLQQNELNQPSLVFTESILQTSVIKGQSYRTVRVPRVLKKSGKAGSVYDIKRILTLSPSLEAAVREIHPVSPVDFLESLLKSGTLIGGSPDWQQEPKFPKCDVCKKSMTLIVQTSDSSGAQVYLFGCRRHPDSTATLYQLD